MPISYSEALEIIEKVASQNSTAFAEAIEYLPLVEALGSTAKNEIRSPRTTPPFDTSAMDGYAVPSELTADASDDTPLRLRVLGTIAAGSAPIDVPAGLDESSVLSCVEIMTGAQFPQSSTNEMQFDACIPVEHVQVLEGNGQKGSLLEIRKPAGHYQHRRRAGNDFQKGDLIMNAGEVVQPQHIMALASLGIHGLDVRKKVRVGVFSTGAELLHRPEPQLDGKDRRQPEPANGIYESNGSYITATLRSIGVDATFLGILDDDLERLTEALMQAVRSCKYDVLVTSGAVSAGRFDFVKSALSNIGAVINFHKLAIRPGHPALFASLPTRDRLDLLHGTKGSDGTQSNTSAPRLVFFGLPGNPMACATCLQFLVFPYIYSLAPNSRAQLPAVLAHVLDNQTSTPTYPSERPRKPTIRNDTDLDIFKHGHLMNGDMGWCVALSDDQGSGKVAPFSRANCWIHIPTRWRVTAESPSMLRCIPFPNANTV